MADTKITALAAIATVDPAADVLPIVDISDTSMAASGTTKKVTTNQILGSSGVATLASATITGDLTVDTSTLKVDATNDRVGIGTATPASKLIVRDGSNRNFLVSSDASQLGSAGVAIGSFTDNAAAYAPLSLVASSMQFSNSTSATYLIGGTTAMTLNSTGLGVGTSPANGIKLSSFVTSEGAPATSGTTQASGSLRIGAASTAGAMDMGTAGNYSWIQVLDRNNLATNYNLVLNPNGGNVGIGVTPSSGTKLDVNGNIAIRDTFNLTMGFANQQRILAGGTSDNTFLTFSQWTGAAYTERVRIDASGNLLVGTTAFSTSVVGSQVQPDGTFIGVKGDANAAFFYNRSTAASGTIALFRSNNVTVGTITQDGTNTSYVTSSDYRLKEAVEPMSGGLARVNALKPSIYNWKSNGSTGEGFLAHELAEIVPAAVVGIKDALNDDGTINPQGIDLSKIVPILVAAIQELTAEVNALKNA